MPGPDRDGAQVATVTITSAAGNVRAVRSAGFTVRPRRRCPRCGLESLARDAGRAWRCLTDGCGWLGNLL